MRRAVVALVCAAMFAALPSHALAQTDKDQLAAVADGRLVTVNADGSGLRTLWAPGGEITGLAWSPDGNRLAFSHSGRITVFDVFAGRATPLTSPPDGARDVNPAWSTDKPEIGFRRIAADGSQQTIRMLTDGTDQRATPLEAVTALAWSPKLDKLAWIVESFLLVTGPFPELEMGVSGTPAWSPDGMKVAYVHETGLRTVTADFGAGKTRVTGNPVGSPRWSPEGRALVYAAHGELRTVAADEGAQPHTVAGVSGVTAADWQPCSATTTACASYAPPRCSATAAQATTQADQPVDIPAWPCTDPASLPLQFVLVKAPDHGTLAGQRYTPGAGFTGQDTVHYRVGNGFGESELVRVTFFVVPRPPAAAPPATVKPDVLQRAPFLSARVKPKLDRKRSTLVRLACDQNCTFDIRLTARLRSKKTIKGARVRRQLAAGRILAIRLKLPSKPASRPKTVWITGTVRNGAGESRGVKLPVTVPR